MHVRIAAPLVHLALTRFRVLLKPTLRAVVVAVQSLVANAVVVTVAIRHDNYTHSSQTLIAVDSTSGMHTGYRPELCGQLGSITDSNILEPKKNGDGLNHASFHYRRPTVTLWVFVPLVGVDSVSVRANHRPADVGCPLVARDFLEHGFGYHTHTHSRQHLIGTGSTSI
jgi:hypothetical protein